MINEIKTILKKFDDFEEDRLDLSGYEAKEIKSFFSSHLTELLQSLIVDLEGESYVYDPKTGIRNRKNAIGTSTNDSYMNGVNEGLNLAQDKIRDKLK